MVQTYRSMNFLGIFEVYSPIVIMLGMVTKDLIPFLVVYMLLLMGFCTTFGVLGLGNFEARGRFYDAFKDQVNKVDGDFPGVEYEGVGKYLANLADTMRISVGDFNIFSNSHFLDPIENHIFWATWGIITVVTMIVFLNFIIAEAGASYVRVNEQIDAFRAQAKAKKIAEAEYMMPECS